MKKKKVNSFMEKYGFWIGVVCIVILLGYLISNLEKPTSKVCEADKDCVVFGEDGDCNCGCYHKNALPSDSGGACFCAAPTNCKCINNICEGVFE